MIERVGELRVPERQVRDYCIIMLIRNSPLNLPDDS